MWKGKARMNFVRPHASKKEKKKVKLSLFSLKFVKFIYLFLFLFLSWFIHADKNLAKRRTYTLIILTDPQNYL